MLECVCVCVCECVLMSLYVCVRVCVYVCVYMLMCLCVVVLCSGYYLTIQHTKCGMGVLVDKIACQIARPIRPCAHGEAVLTTDTHSHRLKGN